MKKQTYIQKDMMLLFWKPTYTVLNRLVSHCFEQFLKVNKSVEFENEIVIVVKYLVSKKICMRDGI